MFRYRMHNLLILASSSLAFGCASSGGDNVAGLKAAGGQDAAALMAKIEASMVRVESSIDTRFGELKTTVGAVDARLSAGNIGGGGDSVTAWMYAVIAGGILFYPLVWRPARRHLESRRRPAAKGQQNTPSRQSGSNERHFQSHRAT